MSEKHIGEVVQVIGPVLDIRFAHDELPPLLNAIEIDNDGAKLVAEAMECPFITANSSAVSLPGLFRISSGILILPMS